MAATTRRLGAVVAATTLAMGMMVGAGPGAAGARTPESGERIEAAYTERGPWGAMEADTTTLPGYTVYAPADRGTGGHRHPIITWGNGTLATSATYRPLFEHLTSWGYVIVAADDGWVGGGRELETGLVDLLARGDDPASRYHGTLDADRVGAMGHSQGAGGALWAALELGDAVDSYVAWALPDRLWWCFPLPWPPAEGPCREDPGPADLARLSAPSLLVRGSGDLVAASGPGNRSWYDRIPAPVARATARAGDHLNLDDTVGYVTAWFRYTLDGDPAARAAFTGPAPEIASNPAWSGWASRGLT